VAPLPILGEHLDASFEERWKAWEARGVAHEQAVRKRILIVAIIAGTIALVAYVLLLS
jgi:hypothetical protein